MTAIIFILLFPELLLLVRLPKLLKELSEMVLRVVKLSFLIEIVDSIGETSGDSFGLSFMRFSPEDFLDIIGIFRVFFI